MILLLASLFSCNPSDKKKSEIAEESSLPIERTTDFISPIEKRPYKISLATKPHYETQFTYTTAISGKIGEFVDAEMSEVVPVNMGLENQIDTDIKAEISQPEEIDVFLVMVNIIFDNDIFTNTDYYYTNGARIELVLPVAKYAPLNKALLNLKSNDIDFSGFSITQNIYTPINPEATEIVYGDRPFAAYLTLGQFRESYHLKKRLQMKSVLDIGVMGPLSLGEQVQSTVHELEPTGWEYQVQNSFLINYYMSLEKGIYSSSNLELNARGQANLGTLYNKLGGGLFIRTGSFLPVYRGPMTLCCNQARKNEFQYWFFVSGNLDFVAYDATLQGSLFNNNSPYELQSSELNRFVYKGSIGFAFYYNNLGLELENFYVTPEFKGAYHFKYGRIKLVANF